MLRHYYHLTLVLVIVSMVLAVGCPTVEPPVGGMDDLLTMDVPNALDDPVTTEMEEATVDTETGFDIANCDQAFGSADDTFLKIVNRLDTHIDIHISSLKIPGPASVNYGGIVNENSCDLYGLVSNHTVDVEITQCNSGDYEDDGFPVDCGFGGPKELMRITPSPGVTSTVEVTALYFGGSDNLFVPGILGLPGARALCGESHLVAFGSPMTDAEWDDLVASHTEARDDGLSRNNAIVFGNFTCGSEDNVLCIQCNVALVDALWP